MKIQRYFKPLIATTLVILLAPGVANAASKSSTFKCWTNKDGVRECGNVVPPEYAQEETRTINKRGMTVEVQERAKTQEELAAERQREKEEQQRIADEERRKEEQANYDRLLLGSFTSEADIISARDRKLTSLDATITVNQVSLEKLNEQLATRLKRANELDKKDKPIPDDLAKEISDLQRQADDKAAFIQARQDEKSQLQEQYDGYLKRYRELKGTPAQ